MNSKNFCEIGSWYKKYLILTMKQFDNTIINLAFILMDFKRFENNGMAPTWVMFLVIRKLLRNILYLCVLSFYF